MNRNELPEGAIRRQVRIGTSNRKLGLAAIVVTLDPRTCPSSCPLRDAGCYAETGPLALTWMRVGRGEAKDDGRTRFAGEGFRDLARTLIRAERYFPRGSIVRIGDAGDPSWNGRISVSLVDALVELRSRGHRPIVYTHAPDTTHNRRMAERAREGGVTINRSLHGPLDPAEATSPYGRVTTVPESFWNPGSREVLRCPAETSEAVTCESCGLCARSRGYAIGFTAHGTYRALVERTSR